MTSSRTMTTSALAYAGLFLAGSFLPRLPEGAYSDAEVIALLSDAGSRWAIVVAGLLLVLAGLALLPFLAVLFTRLRAADRTSCLPVVVLGAGMVHVVMLLVAAQFFSGYATGIAVGEVPVPSEATLFRVLSNQGFGVMLVPGLVAAGVMMAATSLASREHQGMMPGWLVVTGLVMAALTLAGPLWIPQFLPVIWVVLVGLAHPARSASERGPVVAAG